MKTEALYSIVYISEHAPQLSAAELKGLDLLDSTATGNLRITGCLTTYNGNVVQVLEGNHELITQLFQKIETSAKHQNLTLIWSGPIKNRNFSKYHIINFNEIKASNSYDQRAMIEFKIKSILNNHEKNLAQSIFLETLKQMS